MSFSPRVLIGTGLSLIVFAIVGLAGPGRIDIVDGQTRYEVARSFVDHGDAAIRDPEIWFGRFPGRGGKDFANYRLPQSVLGVPAILLSDVTGGKSESRRHFFFSLTSAFAAAILAPLFFAWFMRRGLDVRRSLLWAAGGAFCTPVFYYGTSTFDDILGTCSSVAALVVAARGASTRNAAIAGLMVGLAFNCKQPLGVIGLPVLVLLAAAVKDHSQRNRNWAVTTACAALGVAIYLGYERYKFPPGAHEPHVALLLQYMPVWPSNPVRNLAVLTLSPAAGFLWYCPPALLGIVGLTRAGRSLRLSMAAAVVIFSVFISSMTIFKGDPSWGPRYFTPVFGWLWLFAPDAVGVLAPAIVRLTLVAGLLVQVAALAIDPHRLYVERNLPSMFGAVAPVLYFDPANAHLLNRPREILEVWRARHESGTAYSPAPSPTFAFPVLDRMTRGPDAARQYKLLNAYRPWWVSHSYLPATDRPVSIPTTAAIHAIAFIVGLVLIQRRD